MILYACDVTSYNPRVKLVHSRFIGATVLTAMIKNMVDSLTEVLYSENPLTEFLNGNNFSYASHSGYNTGRTVHGQNTGINAS